MNILRQLELEHMKPSIPDFGIGDTVEVHYLIKEGDKERVQLFAGTVISLQGGGSRRSATVRRLVAGRASNARSRCTRRAWPTSRSGRGDVVRRAKLYYLRHREGKATRLDPNLRKLQYPRSGSGQRQAGRGEGAVRPRPRKHNSRRDDRPACDRDRIPNRPLSPCSPGGVVPSCSRTPIASCS